MWIWLLLVLIIFAIAMLNLLLFIVIVGFERRLRINKLKQNLANFSPAQLSNRMESYASSVNSNIEIEELDNKIKETTLISYKKIERYIKDISKYFAPTMTMHFLGFNRTYNSLIDEVKSYQLSYLEARFSLFELTSDIEIERAILEQLRARAGKVKEATLNNPDETIRENKKLNGRLNRLMVSIKKLDEMIDEQIKHLGEDFIDAVMKIDKEIKTLASELDFMNFHIKHLEEELKIPMAQIVNDYNENKAILTMLEPQIKTLTREINMLKKEIRADIPELKIKKVNSDVLVLDELVSKLNLLIRSNIDYAKLNNKYESIPVTLLEYVRDNNGLFVSEIKRHKIDDEKARLLSIESALQDFENSINKYEREKMSKFNVHSPQGVSNLLLEIVYKYNDYIKVVNENVNDISKVNNATNRVNSEIGLMNTKLLQIEYNINAISGLIRENFEKQKDEFQNKVELLWKNFKNNTKEVDEKTFSILDKLKKKIDVLESETRGVAFEVFFVRETIMFLNKYKGQNEKFDQLLDSVNDSYNQEKFTEALRKSKELIEIYAIK